MGPPKKKFDDIFTVRIQYNNVTYRKTDRQTDIKMDGETPDDSKDRAYAKRRDIENPFVAILQ